MSILKDYLHWRVILSWPVLAFLVTVFLAVGGIALVVDGYWAANIFFIAVAVLCVCKTLHLALSSSEEPITRFVFVFLVCGCLVAATWFSVVAVLHFRDNKHNAAWLMSPKREAVRDTSKKLPETEKQVPPETHQATPPQQIISVPKHPLVTEHDKSISHRAAVPMKQPSTQPPAQPNIGIQQNNVNGPNIGTVNMGYQGRYISGNPQVLIDALQALTDSNSNKLSADIVVFEPKTKESLALGSGLADVFSRANWVVHPHLIRQTKKIITSDGLNAVSNDPDGMHCVSGTDHQVFTLARAALNNAGISCPEASDELYPPIIKKFPGGKIPPIGPATITIFIGRDDTH